MKRFVTKVGLHEIKWTKKSGGSLVCEKNSREYSFSKLNGTNLVSLIVSGRPKIATATIFENTVIVRIKNHVYHVQIGSESAFSGAIPEKKNLSDRKELQIRAPMPGLVMRVEVQNGQSISHGTGLVVLEAMKMENEIKSEVRGTVKDILVKENISVEKGDLLMTILL